MTKPFFSLVIPCYNDGRYAPGQYIDRLLTNILDQGLNKEDIEIIIADDHSKIPYEGTLDRYRDKLNIKYIETDYNYGPGNTRQKGTTIAEGEWLCFADHDDMFYPGSLSIVKQVIEDVGEQYLVETDFNKVSDNEEKTVIESFRKDDLSTWVHGKFYNIENFWKPYHIHFIKDLKTHEDLALGRIVECALHKLNRTATYIGRPTYMWIYSDRSVSHGEYKSLEIEGVEHSFFETHFGDYVESQIRSILESKNSGLLDLNEAITLVISALIPIYTSILIFRKLNPEHYLKAPEAHFSRVWNTVKQELELKTSVAKVMLSTTFKDKMDIVNAAAKECNQPTLIDWLNVVDKLDYESIIDSEAAELIRSQNKSKQDKKQGDLTSNRPFFSVIIACYNDGRYKEGVYLDRLLTSLTKQGLRKDELEVVLSDDCSPVPFDHIVAKYEENFIVKQTKTDYNFAPGNTRAKGVEIATGEWLAFADHDDIYYEDALKKMKNAIIQKNEQHFAFGDFYGVDPDGNIVRKYERQMNWCHGKFYNKDNLWDKYGIHFIHDLKSHEDIAICTQVSCVLGQHIDNYTYLHAPIYAWTDNPQSVSHAKYTVDTEEGPREFLEVFLEDYISATGWIYIDMFKSHSIRMVNAIKGVLEIMCYCYFYTQGFQFRRPDDYYKQNMAIVSRFITECKKTFNMTNKSMYNAIASNNAYMYYQIKELAAMASGRFIPSQTLKGWFDLLSPDGFAVDGNDDEIAKLIAEAGDISVRPANSSKKSVNDMIKK